MCSGQHAVGAAAGPAEGLGHRDLLAPRAPVRRRSTARPSRGPTARPRRGSRRAIDGCGVETYAFRLREVAQAYAFLADPSAVGPRDTRRSIAEPLTVVRDAMLANPEMVAGRHDRLDTSLMKAAEDGSSARPAWRRCAAIADPGRPAHRHASRRRVGPGRQDRGRRRLRPWHLGRIGRGAPPGRPARCAGAPDAGPLPPTDHPRPAWSCRRRVDPGVRARARRRTDRLTPTADDGHGDRSLSRARARAERLPRRRQEGLSASREGEPPGRGRRGRPAEIPGHPGGIRPDRRPRCGHPPRRRWPSRRPRPTAVGSRARPRRRHPSRVRRPPATAPGSAHPGPARDRRRGPTARGRPIAPRRPPSVRPRTTASIPRRSIPTGAARRGTARRRGRTGPSTRRSTPTRASTARNTRRAPGGLDRGSRRRRQNRPPSRSAWMRRDGTQAPPAAPHPTHTTSSWWEATARRTVEDRAARAGCSCAPDATTAAGRPAPVRHVAVGRGRARGVDRCRAGLAQGLAR